MLVSPLLLFEQPWRCHPVWIAEAGVPVPVVVSARVPAEAAVSLLMLHLCRCCGLCGLWRWCAIWKGVVLCQGCQHSLLSVRGPPGLVIKDRVEDRHLHFYWHLYNNVFFPGRGKGGGHGCISMGLSGRQRWCRGCTSRVLTAPSAWLETFMIGWRWIGKEGLQLFLCGKVNSQSWLLPLPPAGLLRGLCVWPFTNWLP